MKRGGEREKKMHFYESLAAIFSVAFKLFLSGVNDSPVASPTIRYPPIADSANYAEARGTRSKPMS